MHKNRLALFIYSTQNIVGCLCALLVLALYFCGVIPAWWFLLTCGAWLFGWLVVPRRKAVMLDQLQDLPLGNAIDSIVKEFLARLPAEARQQLLRIQTLVRELVPRMGEASFPLDARIELSNAVVRDLPVTLNNYLVLPPGFARLHPVQGRRTARELLQEQLQLLLDELTETANGVWEKDADKLVSQGEYLRQKFRPVDFLAG